MTVTINSPVSGPLVADGVNRDWQFEFKVDNVAHMALRITDADGSNEQIVLSGFTIAANYINNNAGGYVNYPVSPAAALVAGKIIYPYRVVPFEQPTAIGNQGGFFPLTHERALDFLEMQIQQVKEITDRAVVAVVGGVGATLPAPEALSIIGWNADASNLENKQPVTLGIGVVDDDVTMAGNSPTNVPSQHAARTFGKDTHNPVFNIGGTGAADITLFNILKERIRASYFGCDAANSASGNRAAINNALNAAGANGALVLLPAGIINVDGTALALTANVDVEGQGQGTVINTNHASADMFTVNAQFVTLRQLYMASSVTRTAGNFVNVQSGGNRFEMRDFHMEGAFQGLLLAPTASARIRAGKIFGTLAGGVGIRVTSGVDLKLRDILMDGPAGAQPFAGIYVPNCGDLTLEDSQIIHQGQDLYLNPGAGQNITSFWANNTFLDTASRSLYMQAVGAGAVIGRCIFDQCWFSSAANEGIRMETGSGGVIDGTDFINPHIFLNAGAGLSIRDSGVTNTRIIQPNIVKNVGDGIFANTGVTKFSIIGGKIGTGAGFSGGNGGNGINLAGSNDIYIIKGVDLTGNTGAAMLGHTPGANKIAEGNLPRTVNDNGYRPGSATSDDAAAGNIGEIMSANSTIAAATVTMTIAAPAVVTWPSIPVSGKGNWTLPIVFSSTGALPTGVTAGTTYWIIGSSVVGNTFQIATSAANALAGTAITTTGSQSGTHTGNTQQASTTITGMATAAIQLTAGDWDVEGTAVWVPANTTVVTQFLANLSVSAGGLNTAPGNAASTTAAAITYNGSRGIHLPTPRLRFSVSAPQIVYLTGYSEFITAGNPVIGTIRARRVR